MSHFNHYGKYLRLKRASGRDTSGRGEYLSTTFYQRGEHLGVLSLWERMMEWDVFADLKMQQHLDWKHSDCTCLDDLTLQPVSPLRVAARLHALGWEIRSAYDSEGVPIEF